MCRAIAAILVILFHYSYPSKLYDYFAYAFGDLAMDLFFVLSGCLITWIILKNGDERGFLKAFYIRRSLRIWPIYFLLVGFYIALLLVKPRLGDLSAWPYYVTYTQTIPLLWKARMPLMAYPLGPTWSLSIEEQFYIFWPAILLAIGVRNHRRLAGFMVVVAILSTTLRVFGCSDKTLPGRSDGFALGGLLAMLASEEARGSARLAVASISALVLGLLFHGGVALATGVGSWILWSWSRRPEERLHLDSPRLWRLERSDWCSYFQDRA